MKKNKRFAIILLMLAFALVYVTSYVSKKSLAVILPEIIKATSLSKEQLSIPLTALFIAYGVTQIFAGALCDKINTKYVTTIALFICGSMNLAIPYCYSNIPALCVLWGINGFAQAFFWPALVKIISFTLEEKYFATATTFVTVGGYVGQCLLYVISFAFVRTVGFQYLFYFTAGLAFLMGVLNFIFVSQKNKYENKDPVLNENIVEKNDKQNKEKIISLMFIIILFVIVLIGAYRDSLESWTPTFIYEAFHIGSDEAIIGSIALPILSIIFVELSLFLYKKVFKNPIILACVLMAGAMIVSLLLLLIGNKSSVASLVMMALGYGLSSATNHTIISYIPIYYKKTGKISTIASVLNAFTYIGSAVATYLIGNISAEDKFGWSGAIVCWIIMAGLSAVFLMAIIKPWNNKQKLIDNEK